MPLVVPGLADYAWRLQTTTGRPAALYGTALTPGTNTWGAWGTLISGASVVNEVWRILICLCGGSVSLAARDTLVDIGIDPAGGSNFTTIIPYLLGSCAASLSLGGIWYEFPLRIPAGASIGARASVNNATVGSIRVWATLYGLPRNPYMTKVGTFVQAFGATPASSRGTTVTSGTTSEGAWTQLGSALTEDLWWWQTGMGVNDTSMGSGNIYALDLGIGDATNKRVVIENAHMAVMSSAETLGGPFPLPFGFERAVVGDLVYGRMQCSGTPDSALSMIAYGMGG